MPLCDEIWTQRWIHLDTKLTLSTQHSSRVYAVERKMEDANRIEIALKRTIVGVASPIGMHSIATYGNDLTVTDGLGRFVSLEEM